MKKLNVTFLMVSGKNSPRKKSPKRIRVRAWARLGLGLGSGFFFPGEGFFLEAFFFFFDLYQDGVYLLDRGKCLIARNCIYVLNNFLKMYKHHPLDIRQY